MKSLVRAVMSKAEYGGLTPVSAAARNLWYEMIATRRTRSSARTFRELRKRSGLKVHLGSGADVRSGWVNIDLVVNRFGRNARTGSRGNGTWFINHDLRAGLPLAAGSCNVIYSSHFFEHLDYDASVRLLRDSFRVLAPGGIFRLSIPDFRRCLEAYLNRDEAFFSGLDRRNYGMRIEPGTESVSDHLNYVVYQHGEHKCVLDAEKLELLLRKIGFRTAARSSFQPGIDPDSAVRRHFSLYFEATR